ncbi:MAG: SpoIIE family protein phosphatase [Lachnospiraceae bacterium]|nr:SpoIIE family protein phosphatase [Clostridiales bacterium]MDD6293230.1 SpoIIE family protein phosphatase [Eubacteriales bacterium]MDY2607305.1 SpoIIE family protein phosphatase [Lachnospiraceae bacterium]
MNNKTNRIKLIALNLIGIVLAGSNMYGLNPVGMGYSSALYASGSPGITTIIVMLLGMANNFQTIEIVKYISAISVIIIISKLTAVNKLRVNEYASAIICFVSVFALEVTDLLINEKYATFAMNMETVMTLAMPVIMAVFSAALNIAFRKAIQALISSKAVYDNEEMFSMALITGLVIYNIGERMTIPASGIEIILFFSILYGAYKYGAGMGAIIGSACGISLCLWYDDAKYLGIMCMLGIAIGIFRELGRVISVLSMICACITVGYAAYPLFISDNIVKGLLGAGVIFMMLPKNIIYRFEENINNNEENDMQKILEEKLTNAAKAIEKLSKSILKTDMETGNIDSIETNTDINQIWKNKFDESRNIMSGQLNQISKIIEEYSHEMYDFVKITGEEEEYIRHKLKGRKVYMDKIMGIENRRHKKEYLITAKCEKGVTIGTREIAEAVSEAFGKAYMPSRNCRKVISNEFTTTTYVEEANFYVLHGAARKARGESGISGDNYSLKELENGQVLMGISDGMGYGASACLESETVIELLEQLLDSGFDGDTALKMINSVMIMNSEEEHPATLDYGVIDLHSGMCDLVKIGAATTFVKRGNWVETIKSTSMPLGMFAEVDYDSTSKKLYDGDLVIMVSDGVIDALNTEDNDGKLVEIIRDIDGGSPKEIADCILEKAVSDKSRLTDDMTVLVTGIWENNKKIA